MSAMSTYQKLRPRRKVASRRTESRATAPVRAVSIITAATLPCRPGVDRATLGG
jgi:hypothetical protein